MSIVRWFEALSANERLRVGSKGRTLAHLYQADYPVPNGFAIPSAASAGKELTTEARSQVQA